jgi:AcrR family transcriptional regulator
MRDAARTKAVITRTALELFVRQGITETTTKDIAREAKVAEGALYRHYASKDDLAWHLFATHFTALALDLDRLQQDVPTARGKLEAIIRHVCGFFDRDRVLFSYLLLVQHAQMPKVTPDMPSPVEVFRKVVAGAMARKEIPKTDPDMATAMAMGVILQVALARVYGRLTGPLSKRADPLIAAVWRVLGG